MKVQLYMIGGEVHGRSGRVALPRTKDGMVAGRANLETVKLRRPLRAVDWRRMAADMLS